MVYLRWLVTGLSLWRARFNPREVCVGFVEGKVGLGRVFSPSTSVSSSEYHSTIAPSSFIHVSLTLNDLSS